MTNTAARQYSTRLGLLSPDQFQAALDRHGLGSFVRAEPIPFGNFGQNVFVTSTTGDYVLRGAPHFPWQFPKERYFTDLLHERTPVPVPWPYIFDPDAAIFGWSYAIMPCMPGVQLSDPDALAKLTPADRTGIAGAMGTTLAQMHTLVWPHAGEYDLVTNTIQPFGVSHRQWVFSCIERYLRLAVPLSDRTTAVDVAWVEGLMMQNGWALAVPFEPCFVMQDYKEGNAVAQCTEGVWRISGVFDYMEPYFGDGEADLPRQVAVYADEDPAYARAFVEAYSEEMRACGRPLRPGFAERFRLYMLLDRLIIWQFAQRHGVWWDPELTLQAWASPYTALEVF